MVEKNESSVGFRMGKIKFLLQQKDFSMKPWIKAGLIGATITILFSILSRGLYFLPREATSLTVVLYSLSCLIFLIIYFSTGFFAVFLQPTATTIRQGGVAGLLAGIIVGVLDVTFSMVLDIFASFGAIGNSFQLQQYQQKESAFINFGILICWGVFGFIQALLFGGLGGIICIVTKKKQQNFE